MKHTPRYADANITGRQHDHSMPSFAITCVCGQRFTAAMLKTVLEDYLAHVYAEMALG